MARPRCCRVCKISVFDAVRRHFYFPFSPTFEIAFFKKRELATQFSFLCMSTTVSGSNRWSFAIIGDQSLEVWQHALRMTSDTDAAKSSKLFFLLFFFACFLILLKKAFSERKKALEKFPKKDEGTLQITVQSMTNATFENRRSSKEGNLRLFDHRRKICLYLYFLALLFFLQALLMAKVSFQLLEKIPKGDLAISKTYPEPELFFVNLAGSSNLFSFCLWTCFDPTVR